jgi:Aspartyl protease
MHLPVFVKAGEKEVELKALIDSGAAGTFIDHQFVLRHGLEKLPLKRRILVKNVDGTLNKMGLSPITPK